MYNRQSFNVTAGGSTTPLPPTTPESMSHIWDTCIMGSDTFSRWLRKNLRC